MHKNVDEVYLELLREILHGEDSFKYIDTKRDELCHQINNTTVKFDMRRGFPLLQSKEVDIDNVLAELLWFLRGEDNIKSLIKDGCNIWNKDAFVYFKRLWEGYDFVEDISTVAEYKKAILENVPSDYCSDEPGFVGAIYGTQWRNWKAEEYLYGDDIYEIDQFAEVIELVKKVPMARRNIITAWNPYYVFNDDQCALPPCHWAFEILPYKLSDEERNGLYNAKDSCIGCALSERKPVLKRALGNYIYSEDSYWCSEKDDIVGDVLGFELNDYEHEYLDKEGIPRYGFDLKWNQRSVDTFLGLPYNIASYGALMLIIEKCTGYVPRYLIGNLSNVHIYDSHLSAVKEQLDRKPSKNRVDLKLNVDMLNVSDVHKLKKTDFELVNYKPLGKIKATMLAITNNDWDK